MSTHEQNELLSSTLNPQYLKCILGSSKDITNLKHPFLHYCSDQYVQFLKPTISPNGKFIFKETMGQILSINNEYAEIIDCLGDIVQTNIHNIKMQAANY